MTNGEKLVKVFPDIELYKKMHGGIQIDFDSTWWNAEYKEPTTKTCKTCRNNGSHNGVCDICKDYNCFTEPNKSEIPNRSTTKNDLSSGLEKNSKKLEKGTTKNNLGVDWDELKRKILMEVDGGTDDAWLAYGEVCDRISNSIDEFVADMRGNAKRKGDPIEGNNESYNCENWIP